MHVDARELTKFEGNLWRRPGGVELLYGLKLCGNCVFNGKLQCRLQYGKSLPRGLHLVPSDIAVCVHIFCQVSLCRCCGRGNHNQSRLLPRARLAGASEDFAERARLRAAHRLRIVMKRTNFETPGKASVAASACILFRPRPASTATASAASAATATTSLFRAKHPVRVLGLQRPRGCLKPASTSCCGGRGGAARARPLIRWLTNDLEETLRAR
jgi:hypothetical protein